MSINLPDLDGGSGRFNPPNAPAGGGTPGTSTGSSTGSAFPTGENGGVFASNYFLFMPVQDINTRQCYIGFYDIGSFDDKQDLSSYSYRVEDVVKGATPTVNRVDITYRDLGLTKIDVTVSGVNDKRQVVSATVTVQLGNAVPTGALLTEFVSISLTAMMPQLTVTRKSGPLNVTRAIMRGEVETKPR